MPRVTVDVSDLEKLGRKYKGSGPIIFEELFSTMMVAVPFMETAVKVRTPVGVTSNLRGSIAGYIRGFTLKTLRGEISTSSLYGRPVESGSSPHWVPRRPLILWASRMLGLSGLELRRAVHGIQRAIAIRGTAPQHMFRFAFEQQGPAAASMFREVPGRVTKRLQL